MARVQPDKPNRRPAKLIEHVASGTPFALGDLGEAAWIEVIRKMDEVYSDLIRHETDLEEKNSELEAAQAFIASVLASMSDVLIVCDHMGRVQQVNRAALELTGLTEAEMVGRPLADLLAPDSRPMAERFCHRGGRNRMTDCEVGLIAKHGGETDRVAMNCTPRLDHAGQPAGVVLVGRPVGELHRAYEALNDAHRSLKTAQQQLVHSEKMASLGRLTAGVAHELNNPISFIYGNLHALEGYRKRLAPYLALIAEGADRRRLAKAGTEARIDAILADLPSLIQGTLEGAERVAGIVKNLRRLSFPGAADRAPFDLVETLHTAVQWAVKARQPKPPVAVAMTLPERLMVTGNAGQIHQVASNIVNNALEALEGVAEARLWIEAELDNGSARVTIRDNGPGIPAHALDKVFDPFFTTKPVGQGTGLGLWISYEVMTQHGGSLTAANHPEGGALFTLVLPHAG